MSADLLAALLGKDRGLALNAWAGLEGAKVSSAAIERMQELCKENEELNALMDAVRTCKMRADAAWRNNLSDRTASLIQPILCC